MQKKYAEKLHNRDEIEVKVNKNWVKGYVLGDSAKSSDGKTLYFHIQTDEGFLDMVSHKDLR